MVAKDILFDVEARSALLAGIDAVADTVKVTLGPRGRTVLLNRPSGAPNLTKDGVTIAREISVEGHAANLGAQMLREIALRANNTAGDGTTTAIVLAQRLAHESLKAVMVGLDATQVKRGIDRAADAVLQHISSLSLPTESRDNILEVALIASNGDGEAAQLLADAVDRVGGNGLITVSAAESLSTELDLVEGTQFGQGYLSPHFITARETLQCELKDVFVLLHDGKIANLTALLPLLEAVAESDKPLLIIADDVEGDALAGLIINKLQAGLKVAAVKSPGFGTLRKEKLDDLAVLTGGSVVREEFGTSLDRMTPDQLGRVEKAVISRDATLLVGLAERRQAVFEHCETLRAQMDNTTVAQDQETLRERMASLSGGVAAIRVGGGSEAEMRERLDRFEDARQAVQAAIRHGTVPGSGSAFLSAVAALDALPSDDLAERAGIKAVRMALTAPASQIAENAGFEQAVIVGKLLDRQDADSGLDATTGEIVNLRAAGIIDPTDVAISAFRAAVSAASLLATTEALVVEHEKNTEAGSDEHDTDGWRDAS